MLGFALLAGGPAVAFQADEAAKAATTKAKRKAKEAVSEPSTAADTEATKAKTKTHGKASREAEPSAAPAAEASPSKAEPKRTASDSEIAAAKASGQVWVNTDTGVYHRGGRWYGATKHGKFMSPEEANQAGYRESKTK
jgi:hypothetical protein